MLSVGKTGIRTLSMHSNELGANGAGLLAEALESNDTIVRLDLSRNSVQPMGAASLANALTRNSSLRSLDLSSNKLGGAGVQVLFAAFGTEKGLNNTLRDLGLADNDFGKDRDTINTVCSSIVQNQTLHPMNLQDNKVGDESAVAIAPVVRRTGVLRKLNIGGADIGPATAIVEPSNQTRIPDIVALADAVLKYRQIAGAAPTQLRA
jgi:Ran GTPase-activating protein (RanGAP) involved in mRNA processing and transport